MDDYLKKRAELIALVRKVCLKGIPEEVAEELTDEELVTTLLAFTADSMSNKGGERIRIEYFMYLISIAQTQEKRKKEREAKRN